MQRRMLRLVPDRLRGHALSLAAAASAMLLVTATPSHASVIWNGDASNGSGAFGTFLCDSPNYVYTPDWADGRGPIWGFVNKAGNTRCEAHNVRLNGSEYTFGPGRAYWWGWETMTNEASPATVFQWKSNGTGEQHQQNYPVIMMILDNVLRVWYVAPGEQWIGIGSGALPADSWHRIQLGINAQSGTTGSIEVWLDGTRIVHHAGARTWDDLGNKPRWGVYDSGVAQIDQVVWINDLKMGDTRGDV
ncbi:heparin lyase I family protein [Streptomyces sp. N35]|uniref:heparin lyase I family protein n=1 Tax=Streptomyces sp. N35 TaxID=2795730 RepID=UPI0018F5039D|nr:heparin lyase I family protein [Streptomyces sp. N35]